MQEYRYEGPVMSFERCVTNNWKATTIAASVGKARSNLAYRFKKENGLIPSAKITLPGKIMAVQ